jgi:ferredoxin/flavodoxin---NADP+ reductase
MPLKLLTYNATLVRRQDFTPKLAAFHIRPDEPLGRDPAFVPGQYVALGLNNESRPQLGCVRRSMSLASAPERTDGFEFYIRFVEHPESDNALTHLLWTIREGDRIFMAGKPVGKFTLRDTVGEGPERIHVYVAAGTGLAPFLSMIRSRTIRDPEADLRRIILIHGASYPADLCYADELSRYAERNGLRYFRSVSRPKESPEWKGDTGRAEDYFLPDRLEDLERRAGLQAGELVPSTAGVLLCGLQGTIARCIERLAPRGFVPFHRKLRRALELGDQVPTSLWWEQYDSEPVIDIKDPARVAALKGDLAAGIARLGGRSGRAAD